MRDSRPQPLDALFDDANLLRSVQQRAIALLKLNKTVRSILPKQLHEHSRVANYRNGILVIEVANASWLMRLRYEQPALLSALRAEILPSLASIDIRINPKLTINTQQPLKLSPDKDSTEKQGRILSQESADQLILLAKNSPGKLKEKLERLAALAGESSTSTTNRNKKP